MQMRENGIYRVEFSECACQHCGAGKQWVVVDDEDSEVGGKSFGDEDEAEWFAEYMNEAYRIGIEAGRREGVEERTTA